MLKRKLQVVNRSLPALGICERCNAQFKSSGPSESYAIVDIAVMFTRHKCKSVDRGHNGSRVVKESTENK